MSRGVLLVALLALAGCGSSSSESAPAETHEAGTNEPQASTTAATPSITGFGAADSAWNGAHTEDTNYSHEAAYNPATGLGPFHDEYDNVSHAKGRVTGYEYNFHAETMATAQETILHEQFPSDATTFQPERLSTCAFVLVRSPTLNKALGLPSSSPAAQIEFQTLTNGQAEALNPSSVDSAIISEGYLGIEKITGGKC